MHELHEYLNNDEEVGNIDLKNISKEESNKIDELEKEYLGNCDKKSGVYDPEIYKKKENISYKTGTRADNTIHVNDQEIVSDMQSQLFLKSVSFQFILSSILLILSPIIYYANYLTYNNYINKQGFILMIVLFVLVDSFTIFCINALINKSKNYLKIRDSMCENIQRLSLFLLFIGVDLFVMTIIEALI